MKFQGVALKKLFWSMCLIAVFFTGCVSSTDKPSSEGGQNSKNKAAAKIVLTETMIPGTEPGVELYLRHKYDENKTRYDETEVVLFLEPFSFPTAEAFDVPGYSLMDDFVKKGYDTWAMDFRGFGKSSRPDEMEQPPADNKPVVRLDDCVNDLSAAVEYIKEKRNISRVHLVGWSYGSVVAAKYAADHPKNVGKLVLYGFMHGFDLPKMAKLYEAPDKPGEVNPKMPAYQIIDFDSAMNHWHMMLNGKKLVSDEAYAAARKVFQNSDPEAVNRENNAIRRPMGPLVDLYYIWSNRPLFSMAGIQAPVLVIRGELDFFAEAGVLDKLTGTEHKQAIIIEEATHWAIYEKNRDILINETDRFIKETAD